MKSRILRLVLGISLLAPLVPAGLAHAQLDSCAVSVSPNTTPPSTDTNFNFGLYNPSAQPIAWVQVTAPDGGHLSLESASAGNWQGDIAGDSAVFTQGELDNGYSQGFTVDALPDATLGPIGSWTVQASDDPSGASPTLCDGDTSLDLAQTPSVINISNVGVTNVTPTSVSIYWTTDTASTTELDYGPDSGYGHSTTTDNSLVTQHGVTISRLAPNSPYHFQVTSTTPQDGGTSMSGDNTFLTAEQPPPVISTNPTPTTSQGSNNSPSSGTVPGVKIQAGTSDVTPPVVTITTSLAKAFKIAPTISGTSSDNGAVAMVQYSTDGGRDWLPVDHIGTTNGGHSLTYSFTPVYLTDDGSYKIEVRATDSGGNITTTLPETLVIDRLAPQLGPLSIANGPQSLLPDASGVVRLAAATDYNIAAASVGGPTSVVLRSALVHRPATTGSVFSLTRSAGSGLWNGVIRFATGGTYQLLADSINGAGNQTARTVLTVSVAPVGSVTNASNARPIGGVKVTVYYFEPSTSSWQLWDSAPYNEPNPQLTTSAGAYSLMVPIGKYYLTVTGRMYQSFVSNIFSVAGPTSLDASIKLQSAPHIGSWYLPSLTLGSRPLTEVQPTPPTSTLLRTGGTLPQFNLPNLAGGTTRDIDLLGKPTVLTVLATWSPYAASQLPALASTQSDPDVNVVPVFSAQDPALATAYVQTAGYNLTGLVDPDGALVSPLRIGVVPEQIFVDRSGHIKKVMFGVLSSKQLLQELGAL
jgi:hypothetical protein